MRWSRLLSTIDSTATTVGQGPMKPAKFTAPVVGSAGLNTWQVKICVAATSIGVRNKLLQQAGARDREGFQNRKRNEAPLRICLQKRLHRQTGVPRQQCYEDVDVSEYCFVGTGCTLADVGRDIQLLGRHKWQWSTPGTRVIQHQSCQFNDSFTVAGSPVWMKIQSSWRIYANQRRKVCTGLEPFRFITCTKLWNWQIISVDLFYRNVQLYSDWDLTTLRVSVDSAAARKIKRFLMSVICFWPWV